HTPSGAADANQVEIAVENPADRTLAGAGSHEERELRLGDRFRVTHLSLRDIRLRGRFAAPPVRCSHFCACVQTVVTTPARTPACLLSKRGLAHTGCSREDPKFPRQQPTDHAIE